MIDLKREADVFVLRFDVAENRFRPDNLAAWHEALDEVEGAGNPAALVTTGTGKFYSNGLDLDWMLGEADEETRRTYIPSVLALMARVLTFPAITVAAINGHAFGAGAQISLGHDYRVMRTERGYWCMPEIDMKSPLHPGMIALIKARVSHQTAHELIVTGTRYTAEMALAKKIVDHAVPEAEVLPKSIEIAAALAPKADPAMGLLKQGLYPYVLEALAGPMSTPS
ncbi:MAG: enoyl-CoA hydratase/isomerase family protein [bacterium]|nr:enoyl-CoA hydratase [Deltaproteobacteria bacterium]MCP4905007.1 enoyl-CoA hydratase/isomerase family protein [bacterium]